MADRDPLALDLENMCTAVATPSPVPSLDLEVYPKDNTNIEQIQKQNEQMLEDFYNAVGRGVNINSLILGPKSKDEDFCNNIDHSIKAMLQEENQKENEDSKRTAGLTMTVKRTCDKILRERKTDTKIALNRKLNSISADFLAGCKKALKAGRISQANYRALQRLCLKEQWTLKKDSKIKLTRTMQEQLVAANILTIEDQIRAE